MRIEPLGDKIVVKRMDAEERLLAELCFLTAPRKNLNKAESCQLGRVK